MRGYELEDITAALFQRMGYRVEHEIRAGGVILDMLVERDGLRSPVEVTTSNSATIVGRLRTTAERLSSLADPELTRPIIVVGSPLTPAAKAWSLDQFDGEVWDLADLTRLAEPYPDLLKRLQQFSARVVNERRVLPDDTNDRLQEALSNHLRENTLTPSEYEALCMSVFKSLFDPYLYGFQSQARTSDGGNRYDFICRIQPGNPFWDSLRQDFRTKAILFECKNYENPIGADQVYSTERYLFSGALRTVCLLTSRLGGEDSAVRAAQGAMRESGKLIILLSNADLIEMLKLRSQEGAAEEYLDKRIWDFIVSLPR